MRFGCGHDVVLIGTPARVFAASLHIVVRSTTGTDVQGADTGASSQSRRTPKSVGACVNCVEPKPPERSEQPLSRFYPCCHLEGAGEPLLWLLLLLGHCSAPARRSRVVNRKCRHHCRGLVSVFAVLNDTSRIIDLLWCSSCNCRRRTSRNCWSAIARHPIRLQRQRYSGSQPVHCALRDAQNAILRHVELGDVRFGHLVEEQTAQGAADPAVRDHHAIT